MLAASQAQVVDVHARNVAYDLVLLAHVLCALVGLGAVVVAGGYALALRGSVEVAPSSATTAVSESIRTYYRPGVNWAGRILFAVPVLGVVLVAMSGGEWSYHDPWIVAGLTLWAVVALMAELFLWPMERRIQGAVAGAVAADGGEAVSGWSGDIDRLCLIVAGLSGLIAGLLLLAAAVMVAKP